MFNIFTSSNKNASSSDPARSATTKKRHDIPEGKPMLVEYFSKEVTIPEDFLLPRAATASCPSPPQDANIWPPMTMTTLDWKTTSIPENEGRCAVVLDNVLSRSECDELIRLAESSVDLVRIHNNKNNNKNVGVTTHTEKEKSSSSAAAAAVPQDDPWRPAMINAGGGYEVLDTTYRNSDRIIWDCQDVVDRLWARCLEGDVGEALHAKLGILQGEEGQRVAGALVRRGNKWAEEEQSRWEMRWLNRRMRFLRYGPGQFFKPHCDSYYAEEVDGKTVRTLFTVHLYLNDSVAEVGQENAELVGGATSFLSSNDERKVDVDPKAGRVLIFQHSGLNHSGDWVTKGVKYTMRTEVMYEMVWD